MARMFDMPPPADEEQRLAQERAVGQSGDFIRRLLQNYAFEQAKDVRGLAYGLTVDPMNQMGRAIEQRKLIVEPTPEEAERAKRGLAALAGMAVPGPVGALARRAMPLRPVLGAAISGAAGGIADAGIRTGGDPAAMAGGAAFGGTLGGVVGKLAEAPGSVSLKNPLESTRRSLEEMGEPGKAMAQAVDRMQNRSNVHSGTAVHAFTEAGLDRLSPADDAGVGLALRGKLAPEKLSAEGRRMYYVAKAYLRAVSDRAKAMGLKVKRGDTNLPFESRENYFPQHAPEVKALRSGPIRDDALANAVASGTHPDKATAAKALDSWLDYAESGGVRGGDFYAQSLAKRTGQSIEAARNLMRAKLGKPQAGRFGNLERSREFDFEFYDPSPKRVLARYAENAEKRLAEVEHLGQDYEKLGPHLAALPEDDRRLATYLLDSAIGVRRKGDPRTAGALGLARQAATTKLSPTSGIKNLGQTLNTAMVTDLGSTLGGIKDAFTKQGRNFAEEVGATTEGAMRHSQHMVGAESNALRRYLQSIGFTMTEKFNRVVSSNAGRRYATKMAARLQKNPDDVFAIAELRKMQIDPDSGERLVYQGRAKGKESIGSPWFTNVREKAEKTYAGPGGTVRAYREADIPPEGYRYFPNRVETDIGREASGLTGEDYWRRLTESYWEPLAGEGGPRPLFEYAQGQRPPRAPLSPDELKYAGQAVTDRAQFNSTGMDLPPMVQDNPIMWSAAQYKTYPYQQLQMLRRETIDRLASAAPGDRGRGLRNIAGLAIGAPITGEVINDAVEGVKQTGKEGFNLAIGQSEPGALQRIMAASLGQTRKETPFSPERIMANALAPGAIGILSDVGGALERNPAEYLLGPSIGTAANMAGRIYTGSQREGGPTNSDLRYMYRQIPTVGPLTVDAAVPKSEPKSKPRKARKARKESSR